MICEAVRSRQDYEDTKSKLLRTGELFEDPEFPAHWSSLFYSNANSDVEIVWKRPHDLVAKPFMFIEGPSRWGIVQGAIGNCWFVSALASVSCYPKLIDRMFPNKQSFEKEYCGMFYFRFWQFGQWVTIVVDDRLPVVKKTDQLFFISSTRREEFWSSILEKAYAKFYGCYENLHGGRPSSGLLDLTGGVTEWYKIINKQGPKSFFKRILKYQHSNCILSCGIMSPGSGFEDKLKGNLLAKHAYSITDIKVVELFVKGKGIIHHELLRIKNPWGGVEWEGAWSKKSPQWKSIPEKKRLSLGLKVDEDGEFWMSYQDFEKNFTDVYICTVEPQMLGRKADPAVRWYSVSYLGEWNFDIPKSTEFLNPASINFWSFMQFRVELSYVDLYETDKRCELVVALMQRSQRYHRQKSIPMLVMGYYIFRLQKENEHLPLTERWFKHNKYYVRSRYADSQEITCRFKLHAGVYVVIPITSGKSRGEFLLRMCYEKRGNM